MKKNKKSKYKHIVINRKKYYFYKITWVDITGDAGHATAEEFDKFDASTMTTMGYVYSKDRKFLKTFASYDNKDEVFSDRNIYPIGCILKMEKKSKHMSTREKTNKQKVLDYVQKQFESAKEMKLFQMLRKEVEIGKNGTQRYVIKKGPNKGKIVG
jgi:hypothetical protein